MNKAKKIIIIVLSCVVVLGGIYAALRMLKQKNQNSKTAGVYAVSEIGYDASDMWDNSTLSGNVTVNSEQKVYVGPCGSTASARSLTARTARRCCATGACRRRCAASARSRSAMPLALHRRPPRARKTTSYTSEHSLKRKARPPEFRRAGCCVERKTAQSMWMTGSVSSAAVTLGL